MGAENVKCSGGSEGLTELLGLWYTRAENCSGRKLQSGGGRPSKMHKKRELIPFMVISSTLLYFQLSIDKLVLRYGRQLVQLVSCDRLHS